MQALLKLRYSLKSFLRTPGMSLALLLSIALGIGSNVVVHGFAQGLLRPHALKTADRVVSVFGLDAHGEAGPLSYQEYRSLGERLDLFEWVGAARITPGGAVTLAGQSSIASIAAVTPALAGIFDLPLNGGVIMSRRLWQNDFGGRPEIRGESIHMDGLTARVNGIAPDSVEGLYRDLGVDIWMPLPEESEAEAAAEGRNLWVIGRLRRDVPIGDAQKRLSASDGGTLQALLVPYSGMTPQMADGVSRIASLLGLGAAAVFFIACVNVASFLLGRAFRRSHETSIRIALGASRGQLGREQLWDSVVISVIGGAAGLLLAVWTSHVLPALLFEQDAERLAFASDLPGTVAACAACVAITIACGLLPMLAIPHDRPADVLRRESAGPSKAIRRLRMGLVVAQMTSCCVLVIATAILFAGLRTALQTAAGRRLGHAILATVQAHPDVGLRYFERVEQAARSLAGVSAITWAGRLPGSQPAWRSFRIEPAGLPVRDLTLDIDWFTADSLQLFVFPPKQGRMFGFGDEACRVAVANEEAARKLFDGRTAGRIVRDAAGRTVEIIGVVAARNRKPVGKDPPTIYYNYANQAGRPPNRTVHADFHAAVASELPRAELDMNIVSPNYFDAMGLPLIAGRGFTGRQSDACRVGVVNQEAANLYFAGKAVGAAIIDDRGRRTGIVGVVASAAIGVFQRRPEPTVYFPIAQDVLPRMTMIVGVRQVTDTMLADLRHRIESAPGRGRAPLVVQTLEAHLGQTSLAPLRIAILILGASAATAILLSVLGLFGALSDAARQRRRELAVRIALGAQRWRLIGQVLAEGGRLACAGALAGTLGSIQLSRWLARITPGAGSPALWVWLAAPVVLAAAVVIASVLPARSALIVNPLAIMRDGN